MKRCEKCNVDFPDSFRFCGSCGRALTDSQPCTNCGELNESKWTFCTSCGHALSSEPPETQTMASSELPASQIVSTSDPEHTPPPPHTQDLSRETTIRCSEPGELYGADLYQGSASSRQQRELETVAPLD